MENDGPINLDAATLENAAVGATRVFHVWKDGVYPGLAVTLFLLFLAGLISWSNRRQTVVVPPQLGIWAWPLGLRAALVPLLLSYALTHAFSLASVYFNTKIANANTELYFQNLGLGRLYSLSHAHLFAHATMYFLLAVLVQFSARGRLVTVWAPLVALTAGIFDVVSWWGFKTLSPNFEVLSALTGTAFSASFLVMAYAILTAAFCERCRINENEVG